MIWLMVVGSLLHCFLFLDYRRDCGKHNLMYNEVKVGSQQMFLLVCLLYFVIPSSNKKQKCIFYEFYSKDKQTNKKH